MLKTHNRVYRFIFKYMTTNLTIKFPNFIYSPTFLVKYFTPSSPQTSNTSSHLHTHTQLMALLPISLKWVKEIRKERRLLPPHLPTHQHLYSYWSYPSSYPELVVPILPHPLKDITPPLSYSITLLPSSLDYSYIMLWFYPLTKSFSCLLLPPPAIPSFLFL